MLHILGMGYFHPSNVLTNEFIEALDVGTTTQWIVEKIGILERRTTLPLDYIKATRNRDPREARAVATHTPTDLGVEAAKRAAQSAGISLDKIGLVIASTCTPNETVPAEAQRIAEKLELTCPAYDVLTACPAFALHVDYLNAYKPEMLPEYILCVTTDAMTQKVNYTDRTDGAIWGDGASACVISARHQGRLRVIDSNYAVDPSRCQAVVVDTYGYFHQDGRAVRDFSVRQTVRMIKAFEDAYPLDWNRDIFVGHQANATMLEQITHNRGIPSTNHWHNVTYIGNQGAAGAPASLAAHWDEISRGQKIVVAVLGAGLSWGSVLLEGV